MDERKQPETLRLRSAMPALTVDDLAKRSRGIEMFRVYGYKILISNPLERN